MTSAYLIVTFVPAGRPRKVHLTVPIPFDPKSKTKIPGPASQEFTGNALVRRIVGSNGCEVMTALRAGLIVVLLDADTTGRHSPGAGRKPGAFQPQRAAARRPSKVSPSYRESKTMGPCVA